MQIFACLVLCDNHDDECFFVLRFCAFTQMILSAAAEVPWLWGLGNRSPQMGVPHSLRCFPPTTHKQLPAYADSAQRPSAPPRHVITSSCRGVQGEGGGQGSGGSGVERRGVLHDNDHTYVWLTAALGLKDSKSRLRQRKWPCGPHVCDCPHQPPPCMKPPKGGGSSSMPTTTARA